ncbi:hypothetical protein TSACC_3549 [Terrimicrobium sacchariphilum]|uniref:Uncharacterized protein n=1 Tax=Terrimicrobium sacchariphilum TaxID=690879 RepID=A0A146GED9_TERSA|nr:hypothetical protein [Terrimicrobium sacchariphilum]GAT35483.1 hypothetical protein TSACC_3549 [Terrimicrobium sacchariphilum]
MPYQFHFPLMILVAAALIATFVLRKRAWAASIWTPTMAFTLLMSYRVGAVIAANNGPDMAALGALFALMIGWPWFALLLAGLFALPRHPRPAAILTGVVLATAAITVEHYSCTVERTVQVLAADGSPARGIGLFATAEHDRVKKGRKFLLTDSNGCIRFRYDPLGSIRFEESDSNGLCFSISKAPKASSFHDAAQTVQVTSWWKGILSENASYSLDGKKPIVVFLKQPDELISPSLQHFIRDQLRQTRVTGAADFETLGSLCSNAESFDLISEIAAIIPAQEKLRSAAIYALENVASNLNELHSHTTGKTPPPEAIRHWAGVPPDDSNSVASLKISEKINGYAAQLITASQPYWGDENSSANVVSNLRNLGTPAFSLFPKALENAHPRGRKMMLFAMERSNATAPEMEWALSSNDPDVVAAAYEGVRKHLTPSEKETAIARLRLLNLSQASPRTQMLISNLLANLTDVR